MTLRYELPTKVNGVQLDPFKGFFSVVYPPRIDATNLVFNPSLEVDATGYTAVGGSIARVSTQQKFGAWSLQVTPSGSNSGVYYDPVSLVADLYWFSIWIKGKTGEKYSIGVYTTGGAALSVRSFRATGAWQRVSVPHQETSTVDRDLYILRTGSTGTTPFYIDALQVETDQVTTYLDGDQIGFIRGRVDYLWNGSPSASSSKRIAESRAGGQVIPLDTVGFKLTDIQGLGLSGITNYISPRAIGGAFYGGTTIADRTFSLTGYLYGSSFQELRRNRQALIDLFKPDLVTPPQPITLIYSMTDDQGTPVGIDLEIECIYEGDMSGHTDNPFSEPIALQFRSISTFTAREVGNVGKSLDFGTTRTNALIRKISGVWPTTPLFNGVVNAIRYDPSTNRVYFGGDFTTVGGVTVNHMCYLDDTGFHAINNGVNNTVYSIAIQGGRVVFGGSFTVADSGGGSFENTYGLILWSGGEFLSLSHVAPTTFSAVFAVVADPDVDTGSIYIGGDFTGYNGVTGANRIARAGSGTWHAMGTGMDNVVYALAREAVTGRIYVGGMFITGNSVTLNMIGYWNGTTFVPMGTGLTDEVGQIYAIVVDKSGNVYVGGLFNVVGTVTDKVAVWVGGSAWQSAGTGIPDSFDVYSLALDAAGTLYAGGQDISGSTIALYQLNGVTWTPIDVRFAINTTVVSLGIVNGTDLYVGINPAGTVTVSSTTTVTNPGTAAGGGLFVFIGPGTLIQVSNTMTGKVIYFSLTLATGETAILDLSQPDRISFTSNLRGNILPAIQPGSNLSDFLLMPGANDIQVLMTGTSGASQSLMTWRPAHHSIDASIPVKLL